MILWDFDNLLKLVIYVRLLSGLKCVSESKNTGCFLSLLPSVNPLRQTSLPLSEFSHNFWGNDVCPIGSEQSSRWTYFGAFMVQMWSINQSINQSVNFYSELRLKMLLNESARGVFCQFCGLLIEMKKTKVATPTPYTPMGWWWKHRSSHPCDVKCPRQKVLLFLFTSDMWFVYCCLHNYVSDFLPFCWY